MSDSLVFVTGGSSGIGLALASCVPFPARVIDVSRRGAPGFEHLRADLSDPAGWDAVAELFERELSGFEGERAVLLHSAGVLTPIGFAGEVEAAAYRRNVLLNSAALQILGDAFLRALARSEATGLILNIGSGAASSAYEGWSGYCAGKAAGDQWVRTAGLEQARRGGRCRVISIAPGVVETAMQAEIRETGERDFPEVARFHELHDEGHLRAAEDVAREIWKIVEGPFENGAVLDLRDA